MQRAQSSKLDKRSRHLEQFPCHLVRAANDPQLSCLLRSGRSHETSSQNGIHLHQQVTHQSNFGIPIFEGSPLVVLAACFVILVNLQEYGQIPASHYHAKMTPGQRISVQNRWQSGALQVPVYLHFNILLLHHATSLQQQHCLYWHPEVPALADEARLQPHHDA